MTTKKAKPNVAKPQYEPTSQERTAIDKYLDRLAASPAPRLKALNRKVWLDHPEEVVGRVLLMEAVGAADEDGLDGLLEQLAFASLQEGQIDERRLNFMLSIVKSLKP